MKEKPKRPEKGFVNCAYCSPMFRKKCKRCKNGMMPVPTTDEKWDEYLSMKRISCEFCKTGPFPAWQADRKIISSRMSFLICEKCSVEFDNGNIPDKFKQKIEDENKKIDPVVDLCKKLGEKNEIVPKNDN